MPSKKTRVPDGVKRAIAQGADAPRMEDVVAHFFHAVGGPRAFASILEEEFRSAKPGSLIRSRVLDMVLRSLKFSNERAPNLGDLSLMGDEDLARTAEELINRMAEGK